MEDFGTIIIFLIILFVIVLICRELNCWYLKINARISLMEQMLENQKEMIRLLKGEKGEPEISAAFQCSVLWLRLLMHSSFPEHGQRTSSELRRFRPGHGCTELP